MTIGPRLRQKDWRISLRLKQALGNSKTLRLVLYALSALLFALCNPARAQQPTKVARVGYLRVSPSSGDFPNTAAFRQGLRELGYIEGKDIIIEWRSAEGNRDRTPALAAELVRLNVDVIVTGGSGSTLPMKTATSTIPIVMAQDTDPIGMGFVASLARPGGNITGLSNLSPELSGKRVELLKEIVPRLSRIAIFHSSISTSQPRLLPEVESAANSLGIKLQYLDVQGPKDIESTFRDAVKGRADAALILLTGPIMNSYRTQIIDRAEKSRLAAIFSQSRDVEVGALMSYGVSVTDLYRRAATYVDKILKGAKPADLPVEQPAKFELVINLKTAKQIGLAIPPNVLARADKVIR
jgi:putative ABC transport system substrate-binding protein